MQAYPGEAFFLRLLVTVFTDFQLTSFDGSEFQRHDDRQAASRRDAPVRFACQVHCDGGKSTS